jgi:DNA polymerase-1
MPIQGTAADIMKLAMIQLAERLAAHNYDARMLLQVHDEVVLEVEISILDAVADLVIETMENAFKLKTPLKADARSGENWLEMHEMSQ